MTEEGNTSVPPSEMLEQELQMQKEEAKYNTYISAIGYEGDDSDLETKMDTDSEGQAQPNRTSLLIPKLKTFHSKEQ